MKEKGCTCKQRVGVVEKNTTGLIGSGTRRGRQGGGGVRPEAWGTKGFTIQGPFGRSFLSVALAILEIQV